MSLSPSTFQPTSCLSKLRQFSELTIPLLKLSCSYLSKSAQIGDALDNGIVKLFGFMEYDDLIVVIYERSFGKLLDQMMTKFSDGLTETKARFGAVIH